MAIRATGKEENPMHDKERFPNVFFGASLRPDSAMLAILVLLLFLILIFLFLTLTAQPAQAQTYNVIHNFTGGLDGAAPYAGLTMDQAGNFYGTAGFGGYTGGDCARFGGCGTLFELSSRGSGWVFTPLYIFRGGSDAAVPGARIIIGPDGDFYGTTNAGGSGYGTVFKAKPAASLSPNIFGGWIETVLHRFSGGGDGTYPQGAEVVFDQLGNLYGTTPTGGSHYCGYGCGTVFKLTPGEGGWTETVIKAFSGGQDGALPFSGLIFDQAGSLYGTAGYGGDIGCDATFFPPGCGTVFQLTPSGSGWNENVLYTFHNRGDGAHPESGLIYDQGSLYGTTSAWVDDTGGTVFDMTYPYWWFSTLYSFTGIGPVASLSMDGAGDVYGTTYTGGLYLFGSVFKLTQSGGGWTYTALHDFTGGDDGAYPISNVTFDTNGNLYGTASGGGAHGYGVVWKITP